MRLSLRPAFFGNAACVCPVLLWLLALQQQVRNQVDAFFCHSLFKQRIFVCEVDFHKFVVGLGLLFRVSVTFQRLGYLVHGQIDVARIQPVGNLRVGSLYQFLEEPQRFCVFPGHEVAPAYGALCVGRRAVKVFHLEEILQRLVVVAQGCQALPDLEQQVQV